MAGTFRFINQPFNLGGLGLKNRLVMPPMLTNYAAADGTVSGRQMAYYTARAEGGVGMIIVEATAVSPEGSGGPNLLRLDEDRYVPSLSKLVDMAHAQGVKILVQLIHAGRQTLSAITGSQSVAPSPIACAPYNEVPRELTIKEIKIIQKKFVAAAKRARIAGFDGIEFHGGHGYLIHQFLSPRSNLRSDEYGGDLSHRTRFLLEIFEGMRNELPQDFIIGCRLNYQDYVEGGIVPAEAEETAVVMDGLGISYLHVSCGVAESLHMSVPPMYVPRGFLVQSAAAIKRKVAAAVIAVGRINDPRLAESVLEEGKADLVSVGRALWTDPQFPNKAFEGRLDEIRPCIACNQGCRRKADRWCLMNPEAGRENELRLVPAGRRKKVLVVGGGPAGLEFARGAALRGHSVTLWEKSSQLGGNFRLAALPPSRDEIANGLNYFIRELERSGVEVVLNREATAKNINEFQPDEVVIAVGAVPSRPSIPGIDQLHVTTAAEVLDNPRIVKQDVLIIGGGLVGCETADFLAAKGKNVTVVEMLPNIAGDADASVVRFLFPRLEEQKVNILTSCTVKQILENEVIIEKDNQNISLAPLDTVVIAAGYTAATHLAGQLKSSSFGIRTIGDASEPRDALWAIYQGARLAREI